MRSRGGGFQEDGRYAGGFDLVAVAEAAVGYERIVGPHFAIVVLDKVVTLHGLEGMDQIKYAGLERTTCGISVVLRVEAGCGPGRCAA